MSISRKSTLEAVQNHSAYQAKVKKLVTKTVGCSASGEETEGAGECLKVEFKQIACEEEIKMAGEVTWEPGKPLNGASLDLIEDLVLKHDGKEFGRVGTEPVIVMPFVELPAQMELFFVYKGKHQKDYKVSGHNFVLKLGEAGAVASGGCCTIA